VVALVFGSAPLAQMVGSDPINLVARGFVHGLRDLGWIEGRTIIIERRTAEGQPQRAPAIMAELLTRGVDVIVLASARWLHEAAQQATRTVPIIAEFRDAPVAAGLISSLARPGGNLSGVTSTTGPEFDAKRLQLLQEVAQRLARTAFVATRDVLEQYRSAASPAGVTVVPVLVEVAEQYEKAFATILRERVDSVMVSSSPVNYNHAQHIATFAATNNLPAIYAFREAVAVGGLMSYGTSIPGIFQQAARMVDRILKGTRPGDLPAEQPTKFELAINLKTAKALGLEMPPSLLARADEVIE
jgi:putative ABC transport system substrate-binding protein